MRNDKAHMKALTDVLNAEGRTKAEKRATQLAFLDGRDAIWRDIQDGAFPATYVSTHNRKFVGAPRKTAIRCDFLLASRIALGPRYAKDRMADLAQRELLFYVLRDREVFPNRTGNRFYCCPKCTSKLLECVSAKVFRYIDNAKWQAAIEQEGMAEIPTAASSAA